VAKSGAGGRAWWWTLAALLVVALVGGVVWWSAASRRPRLPGGALRGANVLLVTIDTLRADRVGAYGGGTLTPSIDALAARGVRFARAYAHVPMTLPRTPRS